ncbi:MAG: DUF748 domain-containing protein [Calditrichaeota bacterium]|nr:MAG: DUF748 domain-containing protein [Calditrichota bacterium]MBL1204243.1 DUF748 domain-containing protein [Calditrichota bacterium]NOG44073.1 DUF748 domain-containing protein [Calditrichota bacterium]
MKKTIIITCLILSFLGLFFVSLPALLKVTGYDTPLKNYLIDKIFAEQGHQLDLQKIEIGLGKFEISEISFLSSNEQVELLIEQIVIDFNLSDFIKNPSNPQNAIREIYLNQPRLIIHQVSSVKEPVIKDSSNLDIFAQIERLNQFNNLRVNNGKIIYENSEGSFIAYAQNLNGWLNSTRKKDLVLNVKGNIFSTEDENFKLNLLVDKKKQDFVSRIDIVEYSFEESIINHFVEKLVIEGSLAGFMVLRGNISKLDSVMIIGSLDLKNMAASYQDEYADNINFNVKIEDNKLEISKGNLNYKNHPLNITGTIENVFAPELYGEVDTKNFPLSAFQNYIRKEIFDSSTVDLRLAYHLGLDNYDIKGSLSSRDITVYKNPIEKVITNFKFSDKGIQLPSILINDHDLSISGNGFYGYDDDKLNINVAGGYQSGEHVLFDRLSQAAHSFNLKLNVDLSSGKSDGNWDYNLAGFDTLLSLNGNVIGDSNTLQINLTESNSSNLKGSIRIADYLTQPNIKSAFFENFPFSKFSSDKIVTSIFDKIDTKGLLYGTVNDLHGQVQVRDRSSADTIFTLSTNLINVLEPHKKLIGKINLKNLNGSYEADFTENFFGSQINFEEGIAGNFYLDLEKQANQLQGEITINDFKIIRALSNSSNDDYRYQGEINGDILFGGSLKEPWMKADLRGDKFVLNDIGYYQPEVKFTADRTRFIADSVKISHNNIELLNGNLEWGLLNNHISGYFSGQGIEIPSLIKSFNLDETLVTGSADYEVNLKGTVKQPYVEANVSLANGTLDGIEYDNLELILLDNIPAEGSVVNYDDHKIELQRLFIEKQGYYHLNSVGTFPLNSKDDVDLLINFDGDILDLLPHWEPFFLDGASLSDISLKFKGTSDEIYLVAADINIDRGELWMNSVAPYVHDISGRILLEEGSNKVNIENLNAYVDDNYLNINTVRDIKTQSGKQLEHWFFKGLNLDFGILALETSDDGVNLNIPGIMRETSFGKLDLSGKTEQEKFYFAGPVKHPLGYGIVTLNEATITYPFIVSKNPNKKPSTAAQFLSNMEWDATVKSGEDVVYLREIPAYIDNVNAEITVDESSEGLHFSGIINKGTFRPIGSLVSTRGRLEYLDQNFKVDRFALDFPRGKDLPDVSGRAWTTIRDSVGAIPKTIYLQLYTLDSKTGQTKQSGDWQDFKFKLVSADPTMGETQEQVLAYLGYSVENFREKATNVGGALTEKYLIRPLLRPIERVLERSLGMDLVRFNSSIARNLFYSSVGRQLNNHDTNPFINPISSDLPYLFLMSSSEVTVGKYLNENLYLTYTGQLVSLYDDAESSFDFNHSLGLEYRFFRNMLVEFEWDRELLGYYNIANQRQYLEDFKIRLRHSFSF